MTGFGRAENTHDRWKCGVEIRSVNNRFLESRIKLPQGLTHLEERLKERLTQSLERGKVDCTVQLQPTGEHQRGQVDEAVVDGVAQWVNAFKARHGLALQVTLGDVLAYRDRLAPQEAAAGPTPAQEQLIQETVEAALRQLLAMRQTEGQALAADITGRLLHLEQLLDAMGPLIAELPQAYGRRLRENLARLAEAPYPEDRILQEIAMLADRCDVSEELTRFRAHLDHARMLMAQGGAVGRKLDFLVQELNREANTLGAKSAQAPVAAMVVEIKSELEKIREQTQNIE